MSFDIEAFLARLRPHALPLIVGGAGLICVLVGIALVVISSGKEQGIIFDSSDQEASTVATGSAALLVDVSGAVVRPNVYKLSANARVQDALIAAGGLDGQADREWVSKNINLANKLSDGAKLYIPARMQNAQSSMQNDNLGVADAHESNLININTASLSELDRLPGVGPVTAEKIINNRPYSDSNELLSKKVLSQKVFDQVKNSIRVY